MNEVEWDAFRVEFERKSDAELEDRAVRYAPGDDRLANFKRNARGRRTKFDVWVVYAGKHWDAINSMIDLLSEGKLVTAPPGEDMLSNFIGLRNYIDLGAALVTEHLGDRSE